MCGWVNTSILRQPEQQLKLGSIALGSDDPQGQDRKEGTPSANHQAQTPSLSMQLVRLTRDAAFFVSIPMVTRYSRAPFSSGLLVILLQSIFFSKAIDTGEGLA